MWSRALVGTVLCSALTAPAAAQGVIVRGTTTAQLLELRPFTSDSVAFSSTEPLSATLRRLPSGEIVACVAGEAWCRFHRPTTAATTVPLLQDLDVTAWGLGRGLSAHSSVRVRGALGSEPTLWPRANDRIDVLSAYLQLDRSRVIVRAGRQFAGTGLGVYNYDGASVSVQPWRAMRVEGFGGWSLVQGASESFTTSELAALDELPPDRNAYLVGVQAHARPSEGTSVHGVWQREVRDNRSALYSERLALDGTWRVEGHQLEASWQQDIATGTTNELLLRWRAPVVRGTRVTAEARRFRPFFELWTIWGAFSPVGFDEARVQAQWRRTDGVFAITTHGARRRWQDTDAGLGFAALRRDGWRAGASAQWTPRPAWQVSGSYGADVGAGASRTEGDASVQYTRGALTAAVTASAFESFYEFRIGTGRVLGLGTDASWQMSSAVRTTASFALYRQLTRDGGTGTDWTQRRALLRVDWMMGRDPGARALSSPRASTAMGAR